MNLRDDLKEALWATVLSFGVPFGTLSGMGAGVVGVVLLANACGAGTPDPKPALDFGQSIAVALCQAEAPRRGFDPALCQAGSDFLRPFVDDAARQFASAALADRGPTVASTPCPPFADQPAPVVPGTSGAGGGK